MWRWGGARAVGVCEIGATEGAGPTLPPRRAVMWGMKQMPAALAQKRLNLNRHSNKGRHRSIRGRHRGLPLQQNKDRHISEQLFLIKSLGAAAVKHLFHAAHNCPPWQYAPPAPSVAPIPQTLHHCRPFSSLRNSPCP